MTVPGSQDLCQILQDVGDDVYQQYRLTRQGSDFDSQSAFHINVSLRVCTENSRVIRCIKSCEVADRISVHRAEDADNRFIFP